MDKIYSCSRLPHKSLPHLFQYFLSSLQYFIQIQWAVGKLANNASQKALGNREHFEEDQNQDKRKVKNISPSPHIIPLHLSVGRLFVPATKSQTVVLLSNNQICITLRAYETISQMICKVSGEL